LERLEDRQLLTNFTVVLATDNGPTTAGQMKTATSGDLRYCVAQADTKHAALSDTITFSSKVFAKPQTITLDSTLGSLSLRNLQPLTIAGPAGGQVTVSGGDKVGVFVNNEIATLRNLTITQGNNITDGGGLFNVGTLTLTDCTLSHDSAGSSGGGIFNAGIIKLTNCTFSNDSAGKDGGGFYTGVFSQARATLTNCLFNHDSAGSGGGIFSSGTTTLTNCTLSNDSASHYNGGGIYSSGTVTLTNCTLSNDSAGGGGGIWNTGTATLTNCTLSNDSAAIGGGIFNTGTATLTNCTLNNDSASAYGGAFDSTFMATLTNCILSNNSAGTSGGGIFCYGTTMLTNCTLSNDSAGGGGGITSRGTLMLTNCTLSNNSAGGGGGIHVSLGTVTLTNCTLSNNSAGQSGGGIYNDDSATLILTNNLVAQNKAATGPDIAGTINTADHDLVGDGTGSSGINNGGGNQVGIGSSPIDPLLGPLQNNGGPTQTLALLPGSPAIGQADNLFAPPKDQRGVVRNHSHPTDIGAFEFSK